MTRPNARPFPLATLAATNAAPLGMARTERLDTPLNYQLDDDRAAEDVGLRRKE
jgi:hypothetical protein